MTKPTEINVYNADRQHVAVIMTEFHKMLIAKYGELTPELIARVEKKVRMLTEKRYVPK